MAVAQRIVVQASAEDKKALLEKARKLNIPVSELLVRAAFAYSALAADSPTASSTRNARPVKSPEDQIRDLTRRVEQLEEKLEALTGLSL